MAPTSVMQQTFWGRIPNATSKIALQGRREQSEHRPSYTEPGSSPSPARISKRKQSHPTRSPLASAAHSKRSHEDMECGLGLHTKSRRLSLDRHIPTPRSLWTDVPARAFRLSFSDEYLRDPHQYVQALISYDTQMNAPTHKSQSAGGSRSRRATPNSSSKPKPNSSTRRSRAVRMHNLQFEQPLSGDSENEDNNSVTTATSDINDLADIDTRASTKALSQDAAFANMDSQPSTAGPDISESQSLSMQTSMSKLHAAAGQGGAKPDPELTGSIDGRSNGSSSTPDSPDIPLAAGSPGLEPATAPAESDNIPSFQRAGIIFAEDMDISLIEPTRSRSTVKWNKADPINVTDMPLSEKLARAEIHCCSVLRLMPEQYLSIKKLLLKEGLSREPGTFKKRDAQRLCRIDVNKTSKIYEWFVSMGWLPGSNGLYTNPSLSTPSKQ
ncbi:hypothetical protein BX667DRAFT_506235 [Coemansia mojavensis]|nr:hypothetical protein BX667DRAFT_506235 [Coemansia mojavensis]